MADEYEPRYSSVFLADLRRLDAVTQRRVMNAIETKLLKDAYRYGRKLAGVKRPGQWRFRVGDYRIRFDIEGHSLLLHRVRHRREVYE